MTDRWEYLTAVWVYASKELAKTPAGRKQFAFTHDLYVWKPGAAEPDAHPLWSSTDGEISRNYLEILNGLGAEGWELVSESVLDSVVGPKEAWGDVGYPVRLQWLFKRRI